MAVSFQRTLYSLDGERIRGRRVGLIVALLLMGAWLTWSVTSSVTIYETTRVGRLEISRSAHAPVPEGSLRIVADFPVTVLGRVRPGQPARMRLDGFPWTEYGMLQATVMDVANESSQGGVRVECALGSQQDLPVALEPGMTGTVEVAVEQLSPARLLLRSAGRIFSKQGSAQQPPGAQQ